MAWNNPPLFLSKLGDPDKWFITLNWSDTKSSVGGVTSGDADWANNKLSIAEYRLTRSTNNGSSYTVVDTNNYLSLDGNKRMKYYECDTLYSIFDAFTENTSGWYTSEISASNKALLLDTSKYTYTNCLPRVGSGADDIIYYRRLQNNKCEVYTGYIDVPDELTYAFVNKNVFAGGMAMLILDLNNNHIFSYKFDSETGSNMHSTSLAEVTLNKGRYKLFVYAFGEGYYQNYWSSIFVWTSETFATDSTPTWSYNGYHDYLSWEPTSGYYYNGNNYTRWKLIRNDYNNSSDLKFFAADNLTSFFRNTDTSKLSYDYCVASASDSTQRWTNPQYKFKIEARNYLFGTSNSDTNAWSTISEASVTLTPTTPATPTALQMKFYEQNQTNGTNPASYYTADPWTAPSNDYMLYQWDINFDNTGSGYGTADYNGVTIGTANKLTPEQYQLEYKVGQANISGTTLRLVPPDATGNYDDFRNTELLANDYYRLGTGTTIYQVSSVTNNNQKHILNHTGSETGIQDIYKVFYINATDKNLPGANPYYPRVYNAEQYAQGSNTGLTSLLRNVSWTYTVKAKNYFVSTASSGFVSVGPYGVGPPRTLRLNTSDPNINIENDKITVTVDESDTSLKALYASNPELFNTADAVDYKSFGFHPYINNVSQSFRYVYTTAQSPNPRVITYEHMIGSNNTLFDLAEGAGSTMKYEIVSENVLSTLSSETSTINFVIKRPAPTSMDSIPLFEWQSDGTNNIKLTLRRSNGGLNTTQRTFSAGNGGGTTICPIDGFNFQNFSAGGGTAYATVDELYWEVKASTALSNGITASFTDYAGTSWTNQDYVVANIGTLALNTEYEIFFRLRNRYIADWRESSSPKVMLKVPNAPTGLSVVLDIVDDNAGTDNTLTFSWTKPTEPGLHYQHNGAADNAALVAHPNSPYIEKYEVSFLDPNGTTEYRFWVAGGSASAEAPTSFTLTGSIPTSNGGGTFYLMPDKNYSSFKIRAYNVRATGTDGAGPYSTAVTPTYVSRTRATANIGVPYSIADVDETYTSSHMPTWNLGGNYAYQSHATLLDGTAASNVKNTNTITSTSSNLGNVLLNRYRNKPGTNNIASFFMRIGSTDSYNGSSVIKSNAPSTNGGFLSSADGCGHLFLNKVEDLFSSGHNNTGQWFKTNMFYWALDRTVLGNNHSGSPKTISFHFYYIPASGSNTVIQNTACTNQYFDKVNSASSISGTPTLSYTPYYVTGIPTLYPGKTQTIRPAFVIDNKSEYYVNSDYISRVTLKRNNAADFNGIMNYMSHEWKRRRQEHTNTSGTLWTADAGYQAIGGANLAATSTTGIVSSKFIQCTILHKNIYGDGIEHNITHDGTNVRWFIYDKKTYESMDNNDSLIHVHLTFPNQAAAHQGTSTSFTTSYRKITMLNPPTSKFNPSTETTNSHISLSSSNYFNNSSASNTTGTLCEWDYGVFDGQTSPDSTHNCLAFYDGKFQSPSALRTGSYAFGNSNNVNYPEIVTLYNHYVVDSTASSKYLGSPASHYADNYRWAFYKFVAQNGPNSAVTPIESQIFLADGNDNNNTNIDFSDLLSTEGTTSVSSSPKVKVCIKSFFSENGSTWKISGWNQVVNGQTSTDVQGPTQSELNGDLTIPASGSKNTNAWTDSIGKKKIVDYSELGNSGQVPSDATWKTNCRPLPFKHGTSKMNKYVKTWHIIAIGIRNDVSRYIGNVYISRKYDDSL